MKNKNGFTLIELIVSLAILTIASSMFILGFVNITNIMSESAIIKNDTNEIYNSILANPNAGDDIINNQNISLTVNSVTKTINGKVFNIEKNENNLDIRLSRFIPNLIADELPTEVEDVEEVDPSTCLTAQFKLITNLAELPESYEALKKHEQEGITSGFDKYTIVKNITQSINPKVTSMVFGGHVGKYIVSEPTDIDLKNSDRIFFNETYDKWLSINNSNNFYAKWFCIEPPTDLSKPYTVYGYLVKKDSRDLVINLNDNIKNIAFYYDLGDDVIDGKKLNINAEDAVQLINKKFKVNDDSTIYNYEDLVNLKFIKDNSKSIYIAKVETDI